jgi:hypothetical protein
VASAGASFSPPDPLNIGLPADQPLASHQHVRLGDLAGERWIQGVRHGATVEVLPRACRLAGFEPQLTVPSVRADIAVRPLDVRGLRRCVRAALPPGAYRPPAALAMLDVLRDVNDGLVADAARRLRQPLKALSRTG